MSESWRDYEPPDYIKGRWCPITKSGCQGAACAWWIPEEKECAIKVLAKKPLWVVGGDMR